MALVMVDRLRFDFDRNVAAAKYDEWTYYRETIQPRDNAKALDIVALRRKDVPATVWLIEAKDFRVLRGVPKPSNISGLVPDVSQKVRDTLAGLEEAASKAEGRERDHSKRAIAARKRRVILHIEPYVGPATKIFPRDFPAKVLEKLKQLVRDIDPNPRVLEIATTANANVPWAVS